VPADGMIDTPYELSLGVLASAGTAHMPLMCEYAAAVAIDAMFVVSFRSIANVNVLFGNSGEFCGSAFIICTARYAPERNHNPQVVRQPFGSKNERGKIKPALRCSPAGRVDIGNKPER